MNNWYEQWSKAGAGPNFRVENPQIYIQKLNWVNHWFEYYFFNKVSDFLLGIFFVVLVFTVAFFSKNKKKPEKDYFYFDYYVILLILFTEWFYNHPALRYGGYSLIALMVFYPISHVLQIFRNSQKKIKKTVIVLIGITTFILTLVLWFYTRIHNLPLSIKKKVNILLLIVIIQFSLGVATLISYVPTHIAITHQLGALIFYSISIWTLKSLPFVSK